MRLKHPCAWFGCDDVVAQQRPEGAGQHIGMLVFAVVTVQGRRQRAGRDHRSSTACRGGQCQISHQPQAESIVHRMEKVIDRRTRAPCYRSSLNVCERVHNKAFPEKCLLWVKLRRTQYEHMFSALHLELGHFSTQLTCHKRAINGHAFLQNSFARFIDVQHWMRPAQLARVGPDRRRNRPPRDVSSPHRAF